MKMSDLLNNALQTLGIGACLLLAPGLFAQETHPFSCGTDEMQANLINADPAYAKKIAAFEQAYRQRVQEKQAGGPESSVVYTIPVVVHIVHNGAPLGSTANPTDATIQAIVAEASQRFRHLHTGAATYANPFYGADTEIELCLASTDPNGNYTTGITRHYDPANAVGPYNTTAPGLNNYAWNKSLYCNLFIMTSMTNASGVYVGGGYDFTIYDSPAFWSGLIAHEVGHYFSLYHTFEGGCPNGNCLANGDRVCDSPPKAASGFTGTPCAAPGNSCTTDEDDSSANNPYRAIALGGLGDQPDMLANYLDYTGSCWDSYTQGQKTRMRANIDALRVALRNNTAACNVQPAPANDAGVTAVNLNHAGVCSAAFTPQVTFKNYGSSALTTANLLVQVDGALAYTEPWTGSLAPNTSVTVTLANPVTIAAGAHLIALSTGSPNGGADGNTYNDTDYRSTTFIGGSSCQSVQQCAPFNPATASGPGNTTVIQVTASFPAADPSASGVQVCVKVEGDISANLEVFTVLDESNTTRGLTNQGTDCGGFSPEFCFIATLAEYNSWIADGTLTVTLNPLTVYINPALCLSNQGCATVTVPLAGPPPPPCTTLSNPANGAANVPITSALTWAAAPGATGYRLRVGTTPGGTDILNNFDAGNVTTYNPPGNFPYNTAIYVKITPYNGAGDAAGCVEENFVTTAAAPALSPTLIDLSATTVRIKYHNPIDAATATAANLKIWGDETGLRAGAYTVSADTVTFVAGTAFRAGELLHITSKSGLLFAGGGATMPFSWVRQAAVTHPTAAVFDTAGTGIILPAAAYSANASYQATMTDMNRDGRQDLVYRYMASGGATTNVLVYLRNADGSFAAPATYTNTESYSVLVGTPDLNNDGFPDLLMIHNVPSRVHVRLNNGAGGLGAATLYTVTNYCNGAKAYDMDRDGDLDIIAYAGNASLALNTISVLKNNGNGTFAAQATTNTSVFGTSCQPADLDNDGDMDLAYTSNSAFSSSKVFRVYKNDGTGALSLNNSETNTLEKLVLSAFDYNGDGNADLITRNPNGEIYLGNAGISYSLATPTAFTASHAWTLSGDLDGDGDLDIFNANSDNGSNWNTLPLKYFLNNGSGTFATTTTALVLPLINTNDLSDYDSDGDLDHIYLNPATGEIRVLLNGNSVTVNPRVFLQGPYNAGTGNMNDQLRAQGLIPKTEPFTALGMALQGGAGSSVADSAAVFSDKGDDSVIDWVMLELRDEADSAIVLQARPFLIQRDGDIVGLDGVSPARFPGVSGGLYFLAIRHRNHLGVMSAAPLMLSPDAISANFANGSTPAAGANALKNLGSGKWGLWAGNANGNNNVKYNGSANDRTAILSLVGLSTPNQIVPGYFRADTNLDGQVKYNGSSNDRNVILSNVGLTTPNNVIGEQLPP